LISSPVRSPPVRKTPVIGISAVVNAGTLCADPVTHLSAIGGKESMGEKKDLFLFRFSVNLK